MKKNYEIIYGKHACLACINGNKREIYEILIQKDKIDSFIQGIPKNFHSLIQKVGKNELSKLSREESKHQGILIKCSQYNFTFTIKNFISQFAKKKVVNFLMLDEIQDPHNLGAIFRTAFCFEIDGIIIQERNTPEITSAVVRSSAGYSEFVNICQVTNLSQAILELKKSDFWIIGLDSNARENNLNTILSKYQKRVFVFGSEGFGMKELVKKNCDLLFKIPMNPSADSMNVSNSVAIVAHGCYNINKLPS